MGTSWICSKNQKQVWGGLESGEKSDWTDNSGQFMQDPQAWLQAWLICKYGGDEKCDFHVKNILLAST